MNIKCCLELVEGYMPRNPTVLLKGVFDEAQQDNQGKISSVDFSATRYRSIRPSSGLLAVA